MSDLYTKDDVHAAAVVVDLALEYVYTDPDDIATQILRTVAPAIVARAKAEAWDEAAEAVSEWMWNNPSPSGIPHDPPRNPYADEIEQAQP